MKKRVVALFVSISIFFSVLFTGQVVSAAKMRGDINLDGSINMKDCLTLRKCLSQLITDFDETECDVNGDGVFNADDILTMRKYLVNNGQLFVERDEGWTTLFDWEGIAEDSSVSGVTVANANTTFKTKSLKYYGVDSEKNPDSETALALVSGGLSKGTSPYGVNPTAGQSPSIIRIDSTKIANATNLRVLLNMKKNSSSIDIIYVGFRLKNGKYYYHRVYKESYEDYNYFYYVGKEYTEMEMSSGVGVRRTYLEDDNPDTYTLTKDDVKNIKYLCFWLESDKGKIGNPLIVDNIEYFEGIDGYDSSDEDAALPMPEEQVNDGTTKYLSISFDDGPQAYNGKGFMDYYMDLAQPYDAKFSFFLIGNNCGSEDVDTLKRAVEEGHNLENHTIDHTDLSKLSVDDFTQLESTIAKKITDLDAWLETNVGVTTTLLRPPYLGVNQNVYNATKLTPNIKACIGGVGNEDYNLTSVDYRMEVFKRNLKDGSVALIHEHYIDNVEVVRRLLEYYDNLGYEFVTVKDMFDIKGVTPVYNQMYNIIK